MKMQFVFGNPIRKSSGAKRKKPLRFIRRRRNPGKSALRDYVEGLKKSVKAKLKGEDEESKPKKKKRSSKMAKKKKKKVVAKKKKVGAKKKKVGAKKKKVGAKKKKAHKKKAHKRKVAKKANPVKKKAHKRKAHKRKAHKKKAHKKKAHKKKAHKRKAHKRKVAKKANPRRKHRKHKKKSFFKGNPGAKMASKFEVYTGHSLPEAGSLALGGVVYGAVNSLMAKIPGVKVVHAQLIKVPVVGSALPTLLVGAIFNMIGEKKKIKALSMLGKGLVGASVVGIGVNASQKIPGLAGVDFTPYAGDAYQLGAGDAYQLGLNRADFGSPADFGELIDINTQALSGVDFTPDMGGVDLTLDGSADFGELVSLNTQALS